MLVVALLNGCATQEDKLNTAKDFLIAPNEYEWPRQLGGDTLAVLVEEALEVNRDLRVAAAKVNQAAAQARISRASRWPELNAAFSANRSKSVMANPFYGQEEGGPELLESELSLYRLSADISWELDLWGRLSDRRRSDQAAFFATELDYHAASLSIAGEVSKQWLEYTEIRHQLELAEQTEASFRANEELLVRRFDTGLTSALDVRLARTSSRSAAATVAALRQQLDAVGRVIEVLLGRYPANHLKAEADWLQPGELPKTGLPAELVHRRPDLMAAEMRYEAAALRSGATRKLRYPRLTLSASVGTASTELGDLLDSDFGVWSLVGGVTAPIFSAGRISAEIREAQAAEEVALEQFAAVLLTAYREVETALAADQLLSRRLDLLRELVEETDQVESQSWEQYHKGLVTMTVVLETQRRAFESRSQLLLVEKLYRQNRVSLHLALGGDRF